MLGKMPTASEVRLGHALRGGPEAVEEAVGIARGMIDLLPRPPVDRDAVGAAESALGVTQDARPVYAYLGDLHPALGTVGLVLERSWLRDKLTGVTRCDSGGLIGRRGAFAMLTTDETAGTLQALTFSGELLHGWEPAFGTELTDSYRDGPVGYVNGVEPDVSTWKDARVKCFLQAGASRDRRLWTWEARLGAGPDPRDVVALALSRGAASVLEDLRRRGLDVPDTVRVLYGSRSSEGSQFHDPAVRTLLAGGA